MSVAHTPVERPGFARRVFGFFGHLGAIVVGFALMTIGIGLGVTVIMIPVAIPLGLFGFGMWLWGLFEYADTRRKREA